MQILYELNRQYECYFVKGNKEEYWLNYRANGEIGWKDQDSTSGSLFYAYNCLTNMDMEFFSQLQLTQEIKVVHMPTITICHGSPFQVNQKLLPEDDKTIEVMNRVTTPLILCGHSHIQRKIVHGHKCVLNPGSVGIPMGSEGKTQFMILHNEDGQWLEEFISLDYDVERVISDMQTAKLHIHAPYWSLITEHILRKGTVTHGEILSRAMQLCKEETGDCVWPHIPERHWAQAMKEAIG
jgi:predicted phosphodiesterase